MIGATFKVTGDRELDRKFAALPAKVQKQILRPAIRDAAKIVYRDAREHAPVRTGAVKKAIRVRAAKRSRTTPNVITVLVIIGKKFFSGKTFYGAFVEFGHRVGKRLRNVVRRMVGADPRRLIAGLHFIEISYQARAEQAKKVAIARTKEGIERLTWI